MQILMVFSVMPVLIFPALIALYPDPPISCTSKVVSRKSKVIQTFDFTNICRKALLTLPSNCEIT